MPGGGYHFQAARRGKEAESYRLGFLSGVHRRERKELFEAREQLLARNKKRRRKGLFYYCGGAAFAPVVIFLLIVMCTWFALLVGFLPEVRFNPAVWTEHSFRARRRK